MTKPSSTDVRSRAREQGLVTAERGRLPRSVLEAYAAAHPAASARSDGSGQPSSAPADVAATDVDRVLERLRAVEEELAAVVGRLEALEGQRTRSLLGLRVTL